MLSIINQKHLFTRYFSGPWKWTEDGQCLRCSQSFGTGHSGEVGELSIVDSDNIFREENEPIGTNTEIGPSLLPLPLYLTI